MCNYDGNYLLDNNLATGINFFAKHNNMWFSFETPCRGEFAGVTIC
jgi:hypothetical protein